MKTAVIGVGNILFQDEGVGVYASKYIEENYKFEDDVTVVDGGVLGFKLMQYYQEFDKVIILDTLSIDDCVGSIYNLPSEELLGLGSYKQTAHEVEVVEMLEICSLKEKIADINVIGIVPKDIQSVNIGLSKELKDQFDRFVDVAMQELKDSNIKFYKRDNVSVEEIIKQYQTPSFNSIRG